MFAIPTRQQEFDAAIAHHQAGRIADADKICQRMLSRNPRDADALHLRGVMNAQAGRFEEAITLIGQAIAIQPSASSFYRNLASAYKDSGQLQAAIAPCRQCLRLQPRAADMHNQLGSLLLATGDAGEAANAFRQAVKLKPDYAEAWNNLGMALAEIDESDEAMAAYRQSIALQPMPQTWNNLANVLKAAGQRGEAIKCYRIAVDMMPQSAEMWNNLGNTLREAGALDESIAVLERSIRLDPELVSAQWNLSLALLQNGDLARGFEKYEWRWKLATFPSKMPSYSKPLWQGQDIAGKTLLVHVEQGRGDVIQFVRYAALIADRGGSVILHCPPEITGVLRNVPGVTRIVCGEGAFDFDFHLPLMSLPRGLGTTLQTIPANIPYIRPDVDLAAIWEERLATGDAGPQKDRSNGHSARNRGGQNLRRVGLVWAGSPIHANDNKRSLTLSQFAPLSRVAGTQFYSLQKGDSAIQAANPPPGLALIDYTAHLHDFADTAAMISQLDLVIAVDTAVAHLAGAMGKAVWVLLPFSPDWRWMADRDDTPWYPTMRLFRQEVEGDWSTVMERVGAEMAGMHGANAAAA
ncbi:MAG TPA: tetratricopeptide repeat protein [Tepidisphaeraceae bacterium]|nr:tetratricopeptide repeat protein [Tepidisphaeraceae bacterium]